MARERLLVDTCIIIEAFRTKCWKALCARFDVETVEKCIEEACTGDALDPGRVVIDRAELVAGLAKRHAVSKLELAKLAFDRSDLPGLDDGEAHLIAWLHANSPVPISLLFSTTDKAAIKATHMLGLLDRMTSLEAAGRMGGVDKRQLVKLEPHFGDVWLASVKAQFKLGLI